jgi:hypothetical protein
MVLHNANDNCSGEQEKKRLLEVFFSEDHERVTHTTKGLLLHWVFASQPF